MSQSSSETKVPKFTGLSLENYLQELSGPEPIPGGGSVSAYVASLAMGLSQMVGKISLKRKKKAGLTAEEEKKEDQNRKTIEKIVESLEKVKRDAFQIVNLDPAVFQSVMDASGDKEKMEDALQNSFRLQADLACLIVMAREWNDSLAGLVKGSIKNDLVVSAGLLEGAFQGAYHTAMINVVYMQKEDRKAHAQKALEELKERFRQRPQS
jgi:formiminotetrahydrofolate cyclodeaminase